VQQRPGISITQIGDELGTEPTGVDRPVRELQQQGAITRSGLVAMLEDELVAAAAARPARTSRGG
jgi:hypothetical protein